MSGDHDEERTSEGRAEEDKERAFLLRYLRGLEAALGHDDPGLPDEGGDLSAAAEEEEGGAGETQDRPRQ